MRKCLLLAALGISALNAAKAEEYPYRYPSYYRTVFIEAATKACVRDEGDNPTKTVLTFCECKVVGVAAFLTAKDLAEMLQGGVHVTPRYQTLADQFDSKCQKLVTGR